MGRKLEVLLDSEWADRRFDKWLAVFKESPLAGVTDIAFANKMVQADAELNSVRN